MASLRPKFSAGFRPATAAELDDASKITPADIARARAKWVEDAPRAFRALLDAKAVKPKKPNRRRSINSRGNTGNTGNTGNSSGGGA